MSNTARCAGSRLATSVRVFKDSSRSKTFALAFPNDACFEIENFMIPDPNSAINFALSNSGASSVK